MDVEWRDVVLDAPTADLTFAVAGDVRLEYTTVSVARDEAMRSATVTLPAAADAGRAATRAGSSSVVGSSSVDARNCNGACTFP